MIYHLNVRLSLITTGEAGFTGEGECWFIIIVSSIFFIGSSFSSEECFHHNYHFHCHFHLLFLQIDFLHHLFHLNLFLHHIHFEHVFSSIYIIGPPPNITLAIPPGHHRWKPIPPPPIAFIINSSGAWGN